MFIYINYAYTIYSILVACQEFSAINRNKCKSSRFVNKYLAVFMRSWVVSEFDKMNDCIDTSQCPSPVISRIL